ncbi:MAG: UDP-N-acetylmuramoyl-L-alanyl-D-glutamate--2,6-diaminopimelate ligase [Planctomycetota bacterium]
MTTPGPVTLAELLGSMKEKGCDAVAMEVSSHALDQGRAAGVQFAAAGFTNLSGDHLDYHHTMDDYAAAKAKLFMQLPEGSPACVNCGDVWSERMLQHTSGRATPFSVGGTCSDDRQPMYAAKDIVTTAGGSTFILHTPDGQAEVTMKLVGKHNVQNALCAASMAGETLGLSVHQLARSLATAEGAPGRLQRVDAGQPFSILVDYAHTDDALANVLSALRPITRGKLRVVFGCGGDRDKAKRPRMAGVAEKLADQLYITSDNPRTEHPDRILDDIVAGLTDKAAARVDADRRAAIFAAVGDADADDVVLIAGKGHETYQIVGTEKLPFDDVEEARRAVEGAAV